MLMIMARHCSISLIVTTLSFLIILSFSNNIAVGSNDINITTDQSTLLILKSHINPPNYILDGNWSTRISVCEWIGVTCGSPRHNRVTVLNISNMKLTGTIPVELGNLSFLNVLDMSGNNFEGHLPKDLSGLRRLRVINLSRNNLNGIIPPWLGSLPQLRILLLWNNNFSGSIPPSLFNISKLQSLSLANNGLNGPIPEETGNLHELKWLSIEQNSISGSIPLTMFNISSLQYMYLQSNSLFGPIPEEISNLYQLERLVLGNNRFSGSIPMGIFNISSLIVIGLGWNNLTGTLPSNMGHMLPNLEILHLPQNSLNGKIPDYISNSSKLTMLSLEQNKFTGPIPNSLGNLRFLSCLHLFCNSLTSDSSQELSFLTSLTKCRHLKDISISFNPLDGFLPTSTGNLSTSVERIYASSCKIKGNIPNEIGNLSRLVTLDLTDNDLSGFVPETFQGMQRLQGLLLRNNKIQGHFPSSLCVLYELSRLDLSQNEVSGPIPDCLGNVTSLRDVYFYSNRLSSSIPSSLWNIKDLLVLDLSENSLSGSLPGQVENLKAAYYINLSKNQFSGYIPITFGNLEKLINLSLASNTLQGSIPSSFCKLISMEWLDLSNNSLSQEIPKSLQSLHSLKYFNVSFNKLRGEIPSGGPFKNFTYEFFVSNKALCGAPLFQVPPCHHSRTKRLMILVIPVTTASLILTMILILLWIIRHTRKEVLSEVESCQKTISGRFSYRQIHQATNGFSQGNLLGTGSFGSVYQATFDKGMVFAVKVFNLQVANASKSFEMECGMLCNLHHRNLTKVISCCSNLDFKALILEHMQNGSLEDWFYSDGHFLDIMQRLDIMIDVASALEYLHHGYHMPVVHCDLKPSNILLDEDMVGHVTDFGISKLLGSDEESNVHTKTLPTLGYIAPEYGTEGLVSTASDVYSYGIILIETFTRRRPSDDMFAGDINMKNWINASVPNRLSQVVDSNLLTVEKEHVIEKLQCISWIIVLALNCVAESPGDRMNMKDILAALKKIKVRFIALLRSVEE